MRRVSVAVGRWRFVVAAIAHSVMLAVYGGGPSFLSLTFLFGLPHRQISPYELSRKKLLVMLTTA